MSVASGRIYLAANAALLNPPLATSTSVNNCYLFGLNGLHKSIKSAESVSA